MTSRPTGTARAGVNWVYFPASKRAPKLATEVVAAFNKSLPKFASESNRLDSNGVLQIVADDLKSLGFRVEVGKHDDEKVKVPVLFGPNGRLRKHFCADGFHEDQGFVLEVEAGRALTNNQFLKDLFQACMMADVRTLCIAVRNVYGGQKDFESISTFFDTLYASNRLALPLEGILLIGY